MVVDTDTDIVAGTLTALADPLRRRIVELLAAEQLCVCHLVDELGVSQSLVSHHVGVLRDAGVIEGVRHSYWTYYRLRPAAMAAAGRHLLALANAAPCDTDVRRPCC